MQSMEKNVEKQMIIRTFEPNLDELKKTARQLAHMQDVSLNLYGQAEEVLIVVTARAFAQAAATELTESVAEQFELSLGAAVYGRGKGSLAYFTAGELIEHEANIAAADNATGALLAEEFGRTKRGPSVFDFGEGSYRDRRYLEKVRAAEERYADEDDLPQTAAARAVAAAKYGHADFGAAVLGVGSGEYVYIAVAHKGYVYLRRLRDGDTAGKSAALMSLELVRRLIKRLPVDNARMFKANSDFAWDEPLKKRAASPYLTPIIILAVLLAALVVACWYFFTHYSFGGDAGSGGALPVNSAAGVSTPAQPDQTPDAGDGAGTPGVSQSASLPDVSMSASTSDASVQDAPDAGNGAGGQNGGDTVRHPFG